MRKSCPRIVLLLALLPSCLLQAQDPGAATWMQGEIIVFRNLDASSAADEQWPAKLSLSYPADIRILGEPQADTGAAPALSPSEAGTEAAPEATAAVAGLAPPVPFVRLEPSGQSLGEAAARIAGSRNYRVLAHVAWRQPLPDAKLPDHILLTGGTPDGEHWELEGYVSIARSRFLHVETRLWLNDFAGSATGAGQGAATLAQAGVALPPVPQPPPPELPPITGDDLPPAEGREASPSAPAAGITVEAPRALRTVLLNESRRVAPGELHYIDHPLFGVLLKLEPFDPNPPAPTGGELPATTPGTAP